MDDGEDEVIGSNQRPQFRHTRPAADPFGAFGEAAAERERRNTKNEDVRAHSPGLDFLARITPTLTLGRSGSRTNRPFAPPRLPAWKARCPVAR